MPHPGGKGQLRLVRLLDHDRLHGCVALAGDRFQRHVEERAALAAAVPNDEGHVGS